MIAKNGLLYRDQRKFSTSMMLPDALAMEQRPGGRRIDYANGETALLRRCLVLRGGRHDDESLPIVAPNLPGGACRVRIDRPSWTADGVGRVDSCRDRLQQPNRDRSPCLERRLSVRRREASSQRHLRFGEGRFPLSAWRAADHARSKASLRVTPSSARIRTISPAEFGKFDTPRVALG